MVPSPLRLGLLPALCLLASPALATSADDCRNKDLDDAVRIQACTEAIEATKDARERADLLLWRGERRLDLGEIDEGLADFDEAQAVAPDWADPFVQRAFFYRDQGDVDAAIAETRRGLAVDPESIYATHTLMDMLGTAGQWEECLGVAEDAERLSPEHGLTYAYRGRCLAEAEDFEAALADYRHARELGLDKVFLRNNMALALLKLGRPAEAVPEARAAVSMKPTDGQALRHLVVALVDSGDIDGAMAAYGEGKGQIASKQDVVANALAWHLYLAGAYDLGLAVAEEWMPSAAGHYSEEATLADTYAHLLAAAGRPDEATEAFLEAAELDPDHKSTYLAVLAQMGLNPSAQDLTPALRACAARGAECRMH